MTSRLHALVAAAALVGGLLLSGCGSDDSSTATDSNPVRPTAAEMDSYLESTAKDASAIADDVIAAYQAEGAYPDSVDGLGELSEGNKVGEYEPRETNAMLCVEHVIDGNAVAASGWYIDATAEPVRSKPGFTSENIGC